MRTLSFQKHPRKVSHYGEGTPRRYGIDENFKASELGCFLEPRSNCHKIELREGKLSFTDCA
jgi:hypothetical protein